VQSAHHKPQKCDILEKIDGVPPMREEPVLWREEKVMKKTLVVCLSMMLALLLCIPAAFAQTANGLVQFTDPDLEDAVRGLMGIKNGPITVADAQKVTALNFGKLPEDVINDLGGIEAFTSLESIRLNVQDVWDLKPLMTLPNLKIIEFGDSAISDLEPLRGMNLKELFLYGNQIKDLSPIADMQELEVLVLAGNQISDVSVLAGLTNLRVLMLVDNPIGDFTPLQDIYDQLENKDFELTKAEAVHFADPVLEARVRKQLNFPEGELTVNNVKDCGYLDIAGEEGSGEKITDLSGIEAFENLESLAAYCNDIEDLTPLASLHKLRELDLGGNKVGDLTPLENLPLQFLVLWGNKVTDLSPLADLKTLEALYIDGNAISDLYPLQDLTGLNTLSVTNNQITDLTPLQKLDKLRYIDVGGNQISDLSPLAGLDLVEFYLYDNQVADISALSQASNLEVLDLVNNQITDLLPLAGKTSLKILHLGGNPIQDFSPVAELVDGIGDKDFELDARTVMIRNGQNPDEVIIFDDPVLLEWVRKAMGVTGDITVSMAANVKELNLEMDGSDWSYPRITSLNGLEYFTGAEWINLGWALQSGEQQVDLSPLSGLVKLQTLQLHCDGLGDISALAGLTNMRNLWIWGNNISDLSALSAMTQMEELWLFGDRVSDISVMANMPNLWCVLMADNNVFDLSPLAGHTKLQGLEIANNPVMDYQVIADIYPQLTQKDFDINDVPTFAMPENADQVITFPDPELERRVRETMNRPQGDITVLEAATITRLELGTPWREDLTGDMMIQNLEGLQYFVNLKQLSLYQNWVADLTPIAGLTGLEAISIDNNGLEDIAPLAGLTNLTWLSMRNNNVADISPLAGMTEITALYLQNNPIADYSPIQPIYDSLQEKDFEFGQVFERYYKPENPDAVVVFPDKTLEKRIRGHIGRLEGDIYVRDIAFIEELWLGNEWQESYAEGDRVTDLTGLENCLNLKNLDLKHSDLRDLSPLGGLKKLESLSLMSCGIEDISPLAGLTTLQRLDLEYNGISDISALSTLTMLKSLHLQHNPITDHSPIQAIYENLEDRDFEYGDVLLLPADPDEVVTFADPLFERLVREYTGIADGPITAREAAQEQRLDFNMQWQEVIAEDTRIHDLTGIEYFINLRQLSFNFHAVTDISMLPRLTRLRELEMGGTGMSDLSVLASMPNLTRLVLFANGIEDISPLAGLIHLEFLQLEHNSISDLTPLAGMTELTTLWLTDNPITEYSPIQDIIPNLTDKDF